MAEHVAVRTVTADGTRGLQLGFNELDIVARLGVFALLHVDLIGVGAYLAVFGFGGPDGTVAAFRTRTLGGSFYATLGAIL